MTDNFDFEKPSPVNPFSVPNGYFDDFAGRIDVLTAKRQIPFYQRYKSYIYVAAMFVLLISIGSFFLLSNSDKPHLNQIEAQTYTEYNDMLHDMLMEEANEDMVIDYILAEAE